MAREGLRGKTLTLKLKPVTFETFTRALTLASHIHTEEQILRRAHARRPDASAPPRRRAAAHGPSYGSAHCAAQPFEDLAPRQPERVSAPDAAVAARPSPVRLDTRGHRLPPRPRRLPRLHGWPVRPRCPGGADARQRKRAITLAWETMRSSSSSEATLVVEHEVCFSHPFCQRCGCPLRRFLSIKRTAEW